MLPAEKSNSPPAIHFPKWTLLLRKIGLRRFRNNTAGAEIKFSTGDSFSEMDAAIAPQKAAISFGICRSTQARTRIFSRARIF